VIASAHLGAGIVAGMLATRLPGKPVVRVAAGLVFGLASHVMLDAIPHSDYGYTPRRMILVIAVCEAVVLLSLSWTILRSRIARGAPWVLAAGLLGSAAPDVHLSRAFLPQSMWPLVTKHTFWFHGFFHREADVFWVGMVNQVTVALVCFACLFAFPRLAGESPDSRGRG
jgi:hypothetical protein